MSAQVQRAYSTAFKERIVLRLAAGERLAVRGAVMRQAKQIAFAEARIESAEGKLVSRATGTFLLHRAE